MEKNKRAQRGAERLIDANKLHIYEYSGWEDEAIVDEIENADTIDAIPVAWIVAQIQDTSGAESSYYSRLLKKWREENGN